MRSEPHYITMTEVAGSVGVSVGFAPRITAFDVFRKR